MTPQELLVAAREIKGFWPDAFIYSDSAIPNTALCVDVDRVWPHECKDDDDCNRCSGWTELVAWIDIRGAVHYTSLGLTDIGEPDAHS